MDHYESDRMMTGELNKILKDLREENTKLKDKDKAANGKWVTVMLIGLVVILAFALFGGGGGHHHYYRY